MASLTHELTLRRDDTRLSREQLRAPQPFGHESAGFERQ